MKFIKGFIIGTFIGFTVGNAVTEQQRQQWTAKVRRQAAPVGQAISDNVAEVANTATEQVTDVVDRAGSTASEKIDEVGSSDSSDVNAAMPAGDERPIGRS